MNNMQPNHQHSMFTERFLNKQATSVANCYCNCYCNKHTRNSHSCASQADIEKQYYMNSLPWVWSNDYFEGKKHFMDSGQ